MKFKKTKGTKPGKPPKKLSTHSLNWILLSVNFVVLFGALYMGWTALQPHKAVIAVDSTQEIATPAPLLKLNTEHARQGAIVEINPETIGKENPFK